MSSKIIRSIFLLIVVLLGFCSYETAALRSFTFREGPFKDFCSDSVYLETDATGRVLEIDYGKCSAKVIGKLDFGEREVSSFCTLHTNHARSEFYAFLQEGTSKKMRFHVATRADMHLRPTEIVIDIDSDLSVTPMKGVALIWYAGAEVEDRKKLIVDVQSGKSIGNFDFDIHPAGQNWTSEDDSTLYCVSQNKELGPFLRIVHINPKLSNRIIKLSDIPSPGYQGTQVNICSVSPQQILLSTGEYIKPSEISKEPSPPFQLHLIQLPALTPTAISANERTPFMGKLYLLGKGQIVYVGLQRGERVSALFPSGKYIVSTVKGDRIVTEGKVQQYNPVTEILLKDGTGSVKPYAKYKFDYVSVSELVQEQYETRGSGENDASILARLTEQMKKDSTRKHLSIIDAGK